MKGKTPNFISVAVILIEILTELVNWFIKPSSSSSLIVLREAQYIVLDSWHYYFQRWFLKKHFTLEENVQIKPSTKLLKTFTATNKWEKMSSLGHSLFVEIFIAGYETRVLGSRHWKLLLLSVWVFKVSSYIWLKIFTSKQHSS